MECQIFEIAKKIVRSIKNSISGVKNLIFRSLNIPLKPKWVVLMITDRCNSRCSHCNIWRTKPTQNPLTPKEIENVFKDKLFKNVEYILGTGGEATVRDDLEEIYLGLHRALPKARLQLSTNALLPERVIKLVNTAMQNNINLDVGVSLDGIGETHDRIRGVKGNFEKADWLLHKLVEIRKKYKDRLGVIAGIVVSDLTVNSIYDVRSYTKKLGIGLVEAWYNTSSFYGNYNEKDKVKMKEKINEIVKSQPPSLIREKWLEWLKGENIKFSCFALNAFCVIKTNGDMVPCLNLWDAKAGNIRENSPTEIWNSDEAKKIRSLVKNCQGCLNSWGAGWSFDSSYYPFLLHYLKHPRILIQKLTKK